MKKILALAVGMLLIPFTAFGMEMMSDSDMDSVTGQSGVAISLANVQIFSSDAGSELWYKGGPGDLATVGIVYGDNTYNYTFLTSIKDMTFASGDGGGYTRGDYSALTDSTLLNLNGNALVGDATAGLPVAPRVLSIRTMAGNESGMFGGADSAHIEIGLPTLEILTASGSTEELTAYIGQVTGSPVGSDDTTTGVASMGTIYLSNSGGLTAILGGAIGITSANSGAIQDNLIMEVQ